SLTGLRPKDIDEVRSLLVDTNFYFLLTTIFVSVFHLLFDFLAFKNDIAFWRKTNNTAGLSTRTVVWRFVSSLIIFLHLWEERSSMLVVVPMGISTCIELWKLCRITKLTVSLHHGLQWGARSQEEQATDQLDAQFMYWLVCLMVPLCLAGSVYSLLYLPHRSFRCTSGLLAFLFSPVTHCFSSGVYAFGFLLMTPQLFLNYRLKSVAHLPWKALTYKAFNTFIDDFFAFIITMPTAHRIACLRDDIVFVIYLYQRWLYPVDKSRTNEFGQRGNDEGQDQQQSDSSQNKSKTAKKIQPQSIKTSGGKEVGRSEKKESKKIR
ncbi:Cleft lip and palate transmembrane protein 1, partial [Fasciola hepatica]